MIRICTTIETRRLVAKCQWSCICHVYFFTRFEYVVITVIFPDCDFQEVLKVNR